MAFPIFNRKGSFLLALVLLVMSAIVASAQTTEFAYQGRLTDSGNPADSFYDFEFRLFDLAAGGMLVGSLQRLNVEVSRGVFTVKLDYGAVAFHGGERFLEIAIRPAGSPDPFTTLVPRQPVTVTPFAIRSFRADTADMANFATAATTATTATNASQLGGVAASQYVLTTDPRMTNARAPTAGSDFYLQNTINQQSADFNIDGNGTLGGALSANVITSQTQYNIGGNRVLGVTGNANTFVGRGTGGLTSGDNNSFFGRSAGLFNISGSNNSFFGAFAGDSNNSGSSNAFFGTEAGAANTSASGNAFFGYRAGFLNTAFGNSFFGNFAGSSNTTAVNNSFFGNFAGISNTTGASNSFFGSNAGSSNTTGERNSFFGHSAGSSNAVQSDNSFFGYQAGSASTGNHNSFFGSRAGGSNTTGENNSFFGFEAGSINTAANNAFFGAQAGSVNASGTHNSFFGAFAGIANSSGNDNSFFGFFAGGTNAIGFNNSFFGSFAGHFNTGDHNSFVGAGAGFNNTTGDFNTFFGSRAGEFNTTSSGNTFLGYRAGNNNTGFSNVFVGQDAGFNNLGGSVNVFIGKESGGANTTGSFNTFIGDFSGDDNVSGRNNTTLGWSADVGSSGLAFATAIGSSATVSNSDTIVLGKTAGSHGGTMRPADTVRIPGDLVVTGSISKGSGSFRIDHPLDPANKYLYHSFVESPDMMNIYNGNVTTDAKGEAEVKLPDYFDALNRDFRYQLTCIGRFAQAIVLEEIKDNSFKIKTNKPQVKVSWQVTGIRRDPFAEKNRIQVEQDKPEQERGKYLYPEAYKQVKGSASQPEQK